MYGNNAMLNLDSKCVQIPTKGGIMAQKYWKVLKTIGEICMAAGSIILGIESLLHGKFVVKE